jgi:hypothetical protein
MEQICRDVKVAKNKKSYLFPGIVITFEQGINEE